MEKEIRNGRNPDRIYSAKVFCACYNGHMRNQIFCLGMHRDCECVQRFSGAPRREKFMAEHCAPSRTDRRCPLYETLYLLNE